jgi:hypothetical protein
MPSNEQICIFASWRIFRDIELSRCRWISPHNDPIRLSDQVPQLIIDISTPESDLLATLDHSKDIVLPIQRCHMFCDRCSTILNMYRAS